jgi:nucleoid DNA-binding protein
MAEKIKAITTYMPRIARVRQTGVKEVANLIAGRTSMNPGSVLQALQEFFYVLYFYLNTGHTISLPGLGTFSTSIKLNGKIKVNLRIDGDLLKELNKGNFEGTITNLKNIGMTSDELVALWNEEHPDDLVA